MAALLVLVAPLSVVAQEGEIPTEGEHSVALADLPLVALGVEGHISGSIADVTVRQVYDNPHEQRIEAVYVFPLPEDAAVTDLVMVIGDRRIRADLRRREEARAEYEEARERGQTASLLEQERPNIFTMSVANIAPGHPIEVETTYVEQLSYRDGYYHFDLPLTVGPRFIPGTPTGAEGTGMLPDTDRVPDASRITPPVLGEGVPTPYEVELDLTLEAPMAIREVVCTSHDPELEWRSEEAVHLTLPVDQRQPDRDLSLRYALAEGELATGLLTHVDDRGGFFTLMVEPPPALQPEEALPKELVFVLDTSGSMSGRPMEVSKAAMRHALAHLNPDDTFRILRFGDDVSSLSSDALANTPENVERALAFVDTLSGEGGTQMDRGIAAALGPAAEPDRLRLVLFLTDGYIGNEAEILTLVNELLGEARLFSLGVGSSVNRFLLDELAAVGRGDVHYVNVDEDPEEAVEAFYRRVRSPVLTDIEVDWGGLPVSDVTPAPIPDVFEGVPLLLTGRFEGGGSGTIRIHGRRGAEPVTLSVQADFGAAEADNPALPFLWARRQVELMERSRYRPGDEVDEDAVIAEIVETALAYRLLTEHTGFVAVEERIAVDASDPLRTVAVPVALPDGVSEQFIGPQVVSSYDAGGGGSVGYGMGGSSTGGGGHAAGGIGMSGSGSGHGRVSGRATRRPAVQLGRAEVAGHLERSTIRRVIRGHNTQFRACYESALQVSADLEGRVVITLTVDADGTVSAVEIVESELGDEALHECLLEEFRRLVFPSGSGTIVIRYPIVFDRQD